MKQMPFHCILLLCLVLLCSSCGDTSDETADAGQPPDAAQPADGPAPDSAPPWKPPFDPTVCKIKPYKWLPPSTMGKVVSKEKALLYSLPKAALEAMLKLSDYKDAMTIKYGAVVYMVRYETDAALPPTA